MVTTIISIISLLTPLQGQENLYYKAFDTRNRYYIAYHLTLNLPSGRYILDNSLSYSDIEAMDNIYSYGYFEIRKDTVILHDVKGYEHIYVVTPEGLYGRKTIQELKDKILTRNNWYGYLEREPWPYKKAGKDGKDVFGEYYAFAFDREVPVFDSAKLKGPTPVIPEGRYGYGNTFFIVKDGYLTVHTEGGIISTGEYNIRGRYLFYHDESLDHTFCLEIFDTGLAEISLPFFWYDTGSIWKKTRSNRY